MLSHLIVTEGSRTEPNILEMILDKYGFNVIRSKKIDEINGLEFDISTLSNNKVNVVVAQAPRTRLRHLLKLYKDKDIELSRLFSINTSFSSIFLIFDVDHTNNKTLNEIFMIHKDETDNGLLLVSSPCIEILTEKDRKYPLITTHLRKYKKKRNKYLNEKLCLANINNEKYICDNFEDIVIYFLDKNVNEFGDRNIMNHPELVINKVKKKSFRSEKIVLYWYFTTVIYVFIAHICGLTKEIDNYDIVRNFFIEQKYIN